MTTHGGQGMPVQDQELQRCSSAENLQPCGTPAAAQRHRRRGEAICDSCREAERRYNRDYARLARQTAAFRDRQHATKRRWDRAHREQLNAARRLRAARVLALDLHDRLHEIDQVVVDRVIARVPGTTANRSERYAAYALLRDRGTSHSAALTHVGASSAMRTLFAAAYDDERLEVSA